MMKCPKFPPPQHNKAFSVLLLLGNGILPVLPTNFTQAVPEKAQGWWAPALCQEPAHAEKAPVLEPVPLKMHLCGCSLVVSFLACLVHDFSSQDIGVTREKPCSNENIAEVLRRGLW